MIRGKRNDAYGRQTLRVDCCGWESYREAVSYIDRIMTYSQMVFMPVISSDISPKPQTGDISSG
jgi:hypothetical protein